MCAQLKAAINQVYKNIYLAHEYFTAKSYNNFMIHFANHF